MTIYIYCKPILCKRLFTNKTMNMLLMRETPMWMNYSRSNLRTKKTILVNIFDTNYSRNYR